MPGTFTAHPGNRDQGSQLLSIPLKCRSQADGKGASVEVREQ